jgi:hypothetical protein
MANEKPNSIFQIGSQQGNINNVAGNQTNYGGQQYIGVATDIRRELVNLGRAISAV